MDLGSNLKPAAPHDLTGISLLLNTAPYIHRHLDWRMPLEWLEFKPFWITEGQNRLRSLLAVPAEPAHVAWVRLFAASSSLDPAQAFQALFEHCLAELPPRSATTIASLAFSDWFEELLRVAGFSFHQRIIVLAWDGQLPPVPSLPDDIHIRRMTEEDIPQVAQIDAGAFESIWQNSPAEILRAFHQSGYATLAERQGEVIGYQISTVARHHLHLARLAVLPSMQGLSIGRGMVYDLLTFSQRELISQVSVNTQDSNTASQKVYIRCGFNLTGESFPVFIYQ